jgi:hypothetical protein
MCALSDAIGSRELTVQCRHCGWSEFRTLSWLGARRDMNCPTCCGVIVLNTSERRREISHLRRQVAALHAHFADMIPAIDQFVNATRVPANSAPLVQELALAGAYRENLSGRGGDARSARGNPRRSNAVAAGMPNWAQKHRC